MSIGGRSKGLPAGLAWVLTLSVGVVLQLGTASPAAAYAPWTCPAGDAPEEWNPRLISTIHTVRVWSRKIELRHHSGVRCAWGRISNGSPGDEVWVDWSHDHGETWEPLNVYDISPGYSQVHTQAYDAVRDSMRVCGKAGDRREIACTPWY